MDRPAANPSPALRAVESAAEQPTLPFVRADYAAMALLVVVACGLMVPLFATPGIVNPGDFMMGAHRIMELDASWTDGIFYPRIGPSFNFGYGAPLFQYYPPLASYVGLVFHWFGLGYIAAAKAVMALSTVLAGLGAYLLARELFGWRPAALSAGLLYIASPYLLLVIYERGAGAEMLMWGIAPWLFWAAQRYVCSGSRGFGLLTASLVSLAMVGHNATALFLVPGVALYAAVLAYAKKDARALRNLFLAMALGAAMTGFYWIPAIAEMDYSNAQEIMFSGGTDVVNNLVRPEQLVQTSLAPRYSGPERFRISLWQFVLGAIGAVVALARGRRSPVGLRLFAVAFVLVLFLQTTWSLLFWERVPYVAYVQFPWRLYGVASLCTALLASSLLLPLADARPGRKWAGLAAASLAAAGLLWLVASAMAPAKSPLWMQWDEGDVNRLAMWERGATGYPLWHDYSLVTLSGGSARFRTPRAEDDPSRLPATSLPGMTILSSNPMRTVLQVEAGEPWTLRLHNAWFPGWQVRVDGSATETVAAGEGGIVSADLPAGAYRVEAQLEDSPLRRAASVVSLLALAIWIVWLLRPRLDWVSTVLVVSLALLMALGIRFVTVGAKVGTEPTATRALFDDRIALVGYELAQTRVCAGESLELATFWQVRETPLADMKLFAHVVTADDSARVAQADVFPADGYVPMTRWESGELVPESLSISLDESVPGGRYQLLLGLYDPVQMRNATVGEGPTVWPGERLALAEIEVADCSR